MSPANPPLNWLWVGADASAWGKLFHWITVRGKKVNLKEQYGVWKACKEPGRGLIGRCIIDGRDNATRPCCILYNMARRILALRWHRRSHLSCCSMSVTELTLW